MHVFDARLYVACSTMDDEAIPGRYAVPEPMLKVIHRPVLDLKMDNGVVQQPPDPTALFRVTTS